MNYQWEIENNTLDLLAPVDKDEVRTFLEKYGEDLKKIEEELKKWQKYN